MGTFLDLLLGNLYCWFESFYGTNLSDHLWGWQDATQSYTGPLLYNSIGLYTLIISAIFMVLYYYVLNHPRFNKPWHWLIVAAINSVVALFLGYWQSLSELQNGRIAQSLLYDGDGYALISTSNCWGFGVANMFVAFIFFFVLSLLFHWWSSNAKYSPFVKF